ncbi:response regulator transcription factor [Lederbergia citri]|uniref:Response regulator n=1 Tax=Lederbergia citri TaxID=2833580 RepID=A0A942TCG5_9BACI|nr:response regulator [Lederbergia citri]MBS4195145.1 response regulator [Lederbergia citri]
MYKVLLVDDEINILRGIAMLVDWEKCGTSLVAEAHHGQMALDYFDKDIPDIVVTDIKMPGMNGIEMIKQIHETHPHVKFIILSGYDEFEFAKTAMAYSVKHYLLKPSNENKIEQALCEVVDELNEEKQKEQFIVSINHKLEHIMPKAKEQFLKELITNKKYGLQEWEYYRKIFDFDQSNIRLRLLVLTIEREHEYEHIFALKETVVDNLEKNHSVLLETTIGERIVILTEEVEVDTLIKLLKEVQQIFSNVYQLTFTGAISNVGKIQDIRNLYKEAMDYLSKRFYLGEGSIIAKNGLDMAVNSETSFQYDHDELILSIRSGDLVTVRQYVDEFFLHLQKNRYDESIVKSHSLELLMAITRQGKKEYMDALYKQIITFTQLRTIEKVREFIASVAEEVTQVHYIDTKHVQSSIIQKILEYIDEHLDEEELTLSKIANEIVYMNSDYLGKLFKKEIGEKFSLYLMKRRINRAIEIFEQTDEFKMFEVAEEVGFGNNPRYFSQVFKKQTGFTPTEYINHHGHGIANG